MHRFVIPKNNNDTHIDLVSSSSSLAASKSTVSHPSNSSSGIHPIDKPLHDINRLVFGNQNFRPQQLEIIKASLNNEDLFVVMPTGGGKSLCYALPAVMSKGVTVVISPLISLIEDQVSGFIQLPNGGIPAAYLTSTCTETMAKEVFEDLRRCKAGVEPFIKLLYVTPERMVKALKTRQILQELYQNEMLARFIIDEAHCVSAWGHDFRKDYASLQILKNEYPEVPIVALTATARKKVADDTVKILQIPNCRRFHTGFDRPNLYFEVLEKPSKIDDTYQSMLKYITTKFPDSTGIVYCMTKSDCEETADFLRANKISADYYHAGQSKAERKLVQAAWLQGQIKVVCATIAYGMGIDMPSVRYVIHLSLAKSIEGYYQEAGRAGRDGNYSECIIFYNNRDVGKLARIMAKPPSGRITKKDLEMLEEMEEYCGNLNNCRRQIFCEKFTEQRNNFVRCKNMCDNCKALNGERRRSFVVATPTTQSIPLQPKVVSKTGMGKTISLVEDEDFSPPPVVPGSRFVKASALHLARSNKAQPNKQGPSASSSSSSSFVSAKTQLGLSSVSNVSKVVDLVNDDNDEEWLEPLQKKSKK